MQKTHHIYSVLLLTLFLLLFSIIFPQNLIYAQELNWTHTGGPMGGIIGGMDISSNGDIYAGVYPFMIGYTGLFKTTDNGDSWNKIETQFEDFQVFSVFVTQDDHIWVGTDYQGVLYRSTDNGLTWENKRNGFNANEGWAIGESKDGVLFAGDANVGRLYRSTNNGDNWEFSANIAPLAFAVDSNNVVYAGSFNGLYSSTDNGITWSHINFLSSFVVSAVLIDTTNGIYCGTGYSYVSGDGLFFSADGGQTWRQLGLAGKEVLALAFDSNWNLFAGTLEDGLFKTTDMGQSWTQYLDGIYKKEVYRLVINQQDDIFIGSEGGGNGWYFYGGGGVFRSTNGGDSFNQVGLPISLVKNIVFSGDSLIISSTPSGVQKYNRYTGKWENIGLHNVEAVTITPSDYLYAATRDDGLFKSTDLGKNWSLTKLTIDTLMPVYNVLAVNDDTLFAATGFYLNLRRSTNGGQDWDILQVITGETYRGLFFNNDILFVIGFNSGTSVLFKSTNFGISFDSLYSVFDTYGFNSPLSALNSGYVFLSSRDNFSGIARSTDNGLTWQQVLYKQIVPTVFANDNGIVITGSDSILVSTNFGSTWSTISQPIGDGIGDYITDVEQGILGEFYFGTSSKGLYEVDLITNIDEESNDNSNYYLLQNFPNPFNPITIIRFSIPQSGRVVIKIYDILGNVIRTLIDEEKGTGNYEIEFDGSSLSTGVYFYRLENGIYSETKKMLLLK